MFQLGYPAQWHAVEAAKIAAVGDGNSEVVNGALVAISEPSHRGFPEQIVAYSKKFTSSGAEGCFMTFLA
jgi:hypothetical protein